MAQSTTMMAAASALARPLTMRMPSRTAKRQVGDVYLALALRRGVGLEEVNKDRLYRGLDHLLMHKPVAERTVTDI